MTTNNASTPEGRAVIESARREGLAGTPYRPLTLTDADRARLRDLVQSIAVLAVAAQERIDGRGDEPLSDTLDLIEGDLAQARAIVDRQDPDATDNL